MRTSVRQRSDFRPCLAVVGRLVETISTACAEEEDVIGMGVYDETFPDSATGHVASNLEWQTVGREGSSLVGRRQYMTITC